MFRILIVLTILFLIPSRSSSIFQGIPLSSNIEILSFSVLFLAYIYFAFKFFGILSAGEGEQQNTRFNKLKSIFKKYSFALWIALFFKTVLFISNFISPPDSFDICYLSKGSGCFFSAENIFDKKITMKLQKLYFSTVKGEVGSWYKNDSYYIEDIFKITINGIIDIDRVEKIKILYKSSIEGTIAGHPLNIHADNFSEKIIELPLSMKGEMSNKKEKVSLTLSKDASINVFLYKGGRWVDTVASNVSDRMILLDRFFSVISFFVDIVIFLFICGVVFFLFSSFDAYSTITLVLLLLIPLSLRLTKNLISPENFGLPLMTLFLYVSAIFAKTKGKKINFQNWATIAFLAILLHSILFSINPLVAQKVFMIPTNDDGLMYQTLARTTLNELSLMGGEPVFGHPPGSRYTIATEMLLFGELNKFVMVLRLFTFMFSLTTLFVLIDGILVTTLMSRILTAVSLLVLTKSGLGIIFINLSEYYAWIFLVIAILLLLSLFREERRVILPTLDYESNDHFKYILIPIMLSMVVIVRVNFLFGTMAIMVSWFYMLWKSRLSLRYYLIGGGLFLILIQFPLMHNLYYGKKFVPFFIVQEVMGMLPIGEIFEVNGPQKIIDILGHRLAHLLVLSPWLRIKMNPITTGAFNIIGIVFLFVTIKECLLGRVKLISIFLMIVVAFSFFCIFFNNTAYYPRAYWGIYLIISIMDVILLSAPFLYMDKRKIELGKVTR